MYGVSRPLTRRVLRLRPFATRFTSTVTLHRGFVLRRTTRVTCDIYSLSLIRKAGFSVGTDLHPYIFDLLAHRPFTLDHHHPSAGSRLRVYPQAELLVFLWLPYSASIPPQTVPVQCESESVPHTFLLEACRHHQTPFRAFALSPGRFKHPPNASQPTLPSCA